RYVLGLDLDMRVAAPEEDAVGQDLLDGPAVDLLPLADALDMQRLAVLDQGMAFLGREDGANQGEAGVARVGGTGRLPRRPARLREQRARQHAGKIAQRRHGEARAFRRPLV